MHQGSELNLQIELAHLRATCNSLAQRNAVLVNEIDKVRERNIELRDRNTRLLSMIQELEAREQ